MSRSVASPPAPSGRFADRGLFLLSLTVFIASGFAALVYQVIWQRMLAMFSGADVFSVTIIVAAFMAGLGVGNLAGGYLADRWSRRGCLLAFAAAELSIAAFALVSKSFYYDFLYGQHGDLAASPLMLSVVLFASLLPPTFFMGVSLPLLARGVTHSLESAASRIGLLYGVNTLGSALGSVAAVIWILRTRSFESALQWTASLNAFAAVLVLPFVVRRGTAVGTPNTASDSAVVDVAEGRALVKWLAIYALAGFIALSLEVVWFRALTVMLKSTAFTFGILLGYYLAGIALGTLAGAPFAKRVRSPERCFLAFQAAIGVYAGVILAVFVALLGRASQLDVYWDYFAEYEPLNVGSIGTVLATWIDGSSLTPELEAIATRFVGLYIILPTVLIFPSCFLMGLSFPFLQRAVQTDLARIGRRVGWLQTANIVGSLVGTGATGWLLLPSIGTAGTLKVLFAGSACFLALIEVARGPRRLRKGAAIAAMTALSGAFMLPSSPKLWAALHGTTPERIVFAEDGSGLSVLSEGRTQSGQTAVFCNGRGESWIPFGGVHSILGFIPALVHPAPEDIAVIGLGSADTLYNIASRSETRSIVCLEIVEPQLETLKVHAERTNYAALVAVLADPRVNFAFTDGRTFIRRGRRLYDIIEADALRPNSAYSGNLYSQEYFRLLLDHLKPGGMAVTWTPTPRIHDTFVSVFPHVLSLGILAIGSDQPIPWSKDDVLRRFDQPSVTSWYSKAPSSAVRTLLSGAFDHYQAQVYSPESDRSRLFDLNHDLFPKDEYMVQ